MAPMWKTKAFPPCAVGGFMSNIKMFPMAMLPGWPFRAQLNSRRLASLNKDSLNNDHLNSDSLNSYILNTFSSSIQPMWGLVCR